MLPRARAREKVSPETISQVLSVIAPSGYMRQQILALSSKDKRLYFLEKNKKIFQKVQFGEIAKRRKVFLAPIPRELAKKANRQVFSNRQATRRAGNFFQSILCNKVKLDICTKILKLFFRIRNEYD